MNAIRTKYLGPTNNRGSRIKAWVYPSNLASVTIPYPYDRSMGIDAHFVAVEALLPKIEWMESTGWNPNRYIESEDGAGYIFVTG